MVGKDLIGLYSIGVAIVALMVVACAPAAPAAPTAAPAAPTKAPAAAPTTPAAAPTKAPAAQPTSAPAKVAFPEKGKTISIIVPYAAGGGVDTYARMLAAFFEKEFGTAAQVVNKPGASAQIGMTDLFNAKPDGYTLSLGVLPTIINQYVDPSRNAPYKGMQDFTLVAHYYLSPTLIAVMTDSPWKTTKDFVDDAKANPEKIRISDSGLLATPHLQVVMLQNATGAKFASVHFDGGAPSVTALLGGHVEAMAGGMGDGLVNYKAGKFRILGIADTEESPLYPGVKTFQAQGYDVVIASSGGIQAPKGTPKEIVDVLSAAVKKYVETPETIAKMKELGIQPKYLDSAGYAKYWADQEARTAPIFKAEIEKAATKK